MRPFAAMIWAVLSGLSLTGQNLILNPGFEDHGSAGTGGTQISQTHVPSWSDPTAGSSDIYYYPSGSYTTSGYPKVDSGFCYCAFYGSPNGKYWCEYLQGTFKTPLVKGVTYRFSMAIAVYNKSGDGGMDVANDIGVTFSETQRSNLAPLANGIHLTPDIKLTDQKMITRKDRWPVYYQDYVAKGGEKYFIMGTYSGKGVEYENSYDKSTYFFGDNFSLVSTKPPGPIPDWVFANDSAKTGMIVPFFDNPQFPGNIFSADGFPEPLTSSGTSPILRSTAPESARRDEKENPV